MKKYEVYIDFYGKKMRVTVDAESQYSAIMIVNKALKIDKVEEIPNDDDFIKDFFGFK